MWNWIKSKLSDATEVARYAIFGCLTVITVMWLMNIAGWKMANGFFGLLGLVLVVFLTLSPKVIQPSAALAGLTAILGKNNPVRGALQGPLWVVSIAKSFVYGFLFFATFLTFWSFENSPLAFWGIFLVAMMLFIWRERHGSMGGWSKWIEWTYIATCAVALLWSTFGDSWNGRSFDPNTGASIHMVDPRTGKMDSLGRTPVECSTNACFSEESGAQLVPMNSDQALSRNVSAWPGLGAEATRNATGLPIWLIAIIVMAVAGVIWMWGGKKTKPLVMAVLLLGAGWAGYTYAWPALANTSLGSSCPDNGGTIRINGQYTLQRGCGPLQLLGDLEPGFTYQVVEGAFNETFTDHIDIVRPFTNIRNFNMTDKVPAATDKIVFRVVSAEDSAALDAAASAQNVKTIFNVVGTN